ncbi:MAG TPA: phenylalanine--tRNA ligase subunit beta [Thermoanaerobaculia bacterium]|jgi:phenylalanyl-tRNA synthetase beta chain
MKFSLDWLDDYLDVAARGGAEGLRAALEQAGLPVETIERTADGEVLDVEITPNRPDAMSHRGLARDIAAMTGVPPRVDLDEFPDPPESGETTEHLTSVVISVPRLCRRFGVRMVRDVANGAAPEKIRRRLESIGAKPISAVVDATNVGLWDMGQPLHAFDFDKLSGGLLIVRKARRGETLVTLDGVERKLEPSDLVVADADRAISLAGIMGGLETAVTEQTRNVLLEAAWWDPVTIRRTSRRLSMHTDASHRFERGANLDAIPGALRLAAGLVAAWTGGRVAPGLLDAHGAPFRVRRAPLRLSRLRLVAGDESLTLDFAEEALGRLGFSSERRGKHLAVAIPLFRQDVRREDDLIEEVLRIHGYQNLPSRLPVSGAPGGYLEPMREVEDRMTDLAVSAGFYETMSVPFVSRAADEAPFATWLAATGAAAESLRLTNPLDAGKPDLRSTLLPGLLDALERNARHGRRETALFEVGRVFDRPGHPEEPRSYESRRAAFALSGDARPHWSGGSAPGFFDAKGHVERLLQPWVPAARLTWKSFAAPAFAPGAAAVAETSPSSPVAVVGMLSSEERSRRHLSDASFLAEIRIDAIPLAGVASRFEPWPAYPSIEADLSFLQERALSWDEVARFLGRERIPSLEAARIVDRWEGEGLPAGKVKTTLRLVFRSPDRTLSQEEVNASVQKIAEELSYRLGVVFER